MSDKIENCESSVSRVGFAAYHGDGGIGSSGDSRAKEDKLSKAEKDSSKITIESIHGLMSQVLKVTLFNRKGGGGNGGGNAIAN